MRVLLGSDVVWRFQVLLRCSEILYRVKEPGIGLRALRRLLHTQLRHVKLLCGFSIPMYTFGPGLSIAHYGTVVVNEGARVGSNCRIHVGVNIGTSAGSSCAAPQIGKNVYVGPGAKIFGSIKIADDIAIGANSVVDKSFEEPGISIGGIPAKKISEKGSKGLVVYGAQEALKNLGLESKSG